MKVTSHHVKDLMSNALKVDLYDNVIIVLNARMGPDSARQHLFHILLPSFYLNFAAVLKWNKVGKGLLSLHTTDLARKGKIPLTCWLVYQ